MASAVSLIVGVVAGMTFVFSVYLFVFGKRVNQAIAKLTEATSKDERFARFVMVIEVSSIILLSYMLYEIGVSRKPSESFSYGFLAGVLTFSLYSASHIYALRRK